MGSDLHTRTVHARLDGRAIALIGLGGIGAPVAQALGQFLCSSRAAATLFLVDGDDFEERNRSRVLFEGSGNKALVKAREIAAACNESVSIIPVPSYVTPRNARRIITEGAVVMLAVDNHATRRCVSDRCRRMRDVLLISGGNDDIGPGRDGTFGSVQVYERVGGADRTAPLTRFHPEIAKPADKRPDQLGCAVLAQSQPQLLFTNLAVASAMLGAFYAWLLGHVDYDELFLDIVQGRMNPVRRTKRSVTPSRPSVRARRSSGEGSGVLESGRCP
jgi:hypothetical protein